VASQWAITRSADGQLHVVRGQKVAITEQDARLGRVADEVLTTETVEPVHALSDPRRGEQWALNAVSYEASWPASRGGGVTVAVVDTGVAAAHQDLAGAVLAGTDLASDANSVDPGHNGMVDPGGHGTHVAGIIPPATTTALASPARHRTRRSFPCVCSTRTAAAPLTRWPRESSGPPITAPA
jgi:subtilisin family serine protease